MIIVFTLLHIACSLYFLELFQNSLLIKLDESNKAIILLQGQVSHIQDENNYQYCPYNNQGCWAGAINDKSQIFEYFQLKLGEFQIYDLEKHSYNTEILTFLHTYMEQQTNGINKNFLTLSPFASNLNSFVYFGYSLCISQEDAYLKTNQNEAILKNQLNMSGIKSYVQQKYFEETIFKITIQYLELEEQIFDISNYSIILDNEIENCIIPIELMMRIYNQAIFWNFIEDSFNMQYQFFYREANQQRIESLGSIKFYNSVNQPLLIMPENYIDYNYKDSGFDFLKLVGDRFKTQIVLGQSFLRNKIIHYSTDTQEIFIEQLSENKCILQGFEKDKLFDFLLFKIIFILIMSIFVYGIFRKIRAQYLHQKNIKIAQQQLILNNEIEVLK
ncbi:unnamed protein product [Paramecium pentaurelia]|uniref:Transmembrane protein n=1 Tax=Paramecium pentaurelia TaxID=43138 RepID=A0A8S1UFG3_9CILI|nr:unnamed protein product [Paramecium pentaurelia]